jgi:hypothetical protein
MGRTGTWSRERGPTSVRGRHPGDIGRLADAAPLAHALLVPRRSARAVIGGIRGSPAVVTRPDRSRDMAGRAVSRRRRRLDPRLHEGPSRSACRSRAGRSEPRPSGAPRRGDARGTRVSWRPVCSIRHRARAVPREIGLPSYGVGVVLQPAAGRDDSRAERGERPCARGGGMR